MMTILMVMMSVRHVGLRAVTRSTQRREKSYPYVDNCGARRQMMTVTITKPMAFAIDTLASGLDGDDADGNGDDDDDEITTMMMMVMMMMVMMVMMIDLPTARQS